MRERLPLPQKIQDAPQLQIGLELYYGAFLDLHSGRQVAYGESPLRWIDIQEYCDRIEVDDDTREDLTDLVTLMDVAYRKHRESKSVGTKGLREKNPAPSKASRRSGQ